VKTNDKPIEKNIGYDGNKPHLLKITSLAYMGTLIFIDF
jgi:hypothetical protein